MFDDEKIKLIEAMPESDTLIVIWIKLICQAGKTNACGHIFFSETIPYSEEQLATILSRPLNTVRLALRLFESYGMISIGQDGIMLKNWERHQNIAGMERIKEQWKLASKRYYDKNKSEQLLLNDNPHMRAYDNHKIEEEEEEDIDKNNTNIDILGGSSNVVMGKENKTTSTFSEYYESLRIKYPSLEYDNEYEKFNLYWHEGKRKLKNAKLAWRNWLDHALKWQLENKENDNGKTRGNSQKNNASQIPGSRYTGAFDDITDK